MFKTDHLECGYNQKLIVKAEPFCFSRGEIHFFIGCNGSGKSTLLKTLAGILPPLKGKIYYHGLPLTPKTPFKDRPIFLPSQPTLFQKLTGNDLLDLYGIKSSPWMNVSVKEKWELTSLLNKKIYTLSSGELQRVLLYATLSHPSDLILLDEPTNFLDIYFSFILSQIINSQKERGRIFLITTHDFNWALRFLNSTGSLIAHKTTGPQFHLEDLFLSFDFQKSFRVKTFITASESSTLLKALSYQLETNP